jgi:hypothetical protein
VLVVDKAIFFSFCGWYLYRRIGRNNPLKPLPCQVVAQQIASLHAIQLFLDHISLLGCSLHLGCFFALFVGLEWRILDLSCGFSQLLRSCKGCSTRRLLPCIDCSGSFTLCVHFLHGQPLEGLVEVLELLFLVGLLDRGGR